MARAHIEPLKYVPPPNPNIYIQNKWITKTGVPAKIRLCVQYYSDPQRQEELDFCLSSNVNNPSIDEVVIIRGKDIKVPVQSAKIQHVIMENRPSFQDMIQILGTDPDVVHILSNSDICFDDTASKLRFLDTDVLALNRWELKDAFQLASASSPQNFDAVDVWVWKGALRNLPDIPFTTGVPGCDNRFCFLLHTAGYRLCNPCFDIKIYHIHNSGVRHYSQAQRIAGPYCFVYPSK